MNLIKTKIPGVIIVEPRIFNDNRGYFFESWQKTRYGEAGLPGEFVQDNVSASKYGVLRGLHLQQPNAQGKLVYVLQGSVYDVAVDVRLGSPTYGQWTAVLLTGDNHRQFYIPPGLAHGFCVTSEDALFTYKCTDRYNPGAEMTIAWNDPDLAIDWPVETPELSAKDTQGIAFRDLDPQRLYSYRED